MENEKKQPPVDTLPDLAPEPASLALPEPEPAAITQLPMSDDMVVLARNPAEMEKAQLQLIGWFGNKVEACKAELANAEITLSKEDASTVIDLLESPPAPTAFLRSALVKPKSS